MSPAWRMLNILAGGIVGGAFSAFFMSYSDAEALVRGVFIGIGVLTGTLLSTLRTFLR